VNDDPTRRRWLLRAVLVVAAGTALYLCLGSPSKRPVPFGLQERPEALELDLGPGRDRGGHTVLVLAAPAGPPEVALDVMVPVTSGALYEVELRGPADEPLIRYERAPIVLDDEGGARLRVPASRFAETGDYQVVLRQFAPDGGVREYRYPFRVRPPSSR